MWSFFFKEVSLETNHDLVGRRLKAQNICNKAFIPTRRLKAKTEKGPANPWGSLEALSQLWFVTSKACLHWQQLTGWKSWVSVLLVSCIIVHSSRFCHGFPPVPHVGFLLHIMLLLICVIKHQQHSVAHVAANHFQCERTYYIYVKINGIVNSRN